MTRSVSQQSESDGGGTPLTEGNYPKEQSCFIPVRLLMIGEFAPNRDEGNNSVKSTSTAIESRLNFIGKGNWFAGDSPATVNDPVLGPPSDPPTEREVAKMSTQSLEVVGGAREDGSD